MVSNCFFSAAHKRNGKFAEKKCCIKSITSLWKEPGLFEE